MTDMPTSLGNKVPPERPRFPRLARTALFIQGLAWLAVITGAAFVRWGDLSQPTGCVPAIMSGIAAVVFFVWSLCLAVRSFLYGEDSGLSVAAIVGFLVIITLVSLTPWAMSINDDRSPHVSVIGGLILVVIPLLAVTAIVSFPPAWWIARLAERRHTAAGKPAWNARRRWKWRLLWFADFAVLFALAVYPFAVYFWCVITITVRDQITHFLSPESEGGWRGTVIRRTPGYVKAGVHDCLAAAETMWPRCSVVSGWQCDLVGNGDIPLSRLRMHLTDNRAYGAWNRVYKVAPDEIMTLAKDIADGRRTTTTAAEEMAGRFIAEHGTVEEARVFLKDCANRPLMFIFDLAGSLTREKHHELVPDVAAMVRSKNPNLRGTALRSLWTIAGNDEREALWRRFAADPDPALRQEVVQHIRDSTFRGDNATVTLLLLLFLEDNNLLVRRQTVFALRGVASPKLTVVWAKRLLALLDDPDPPIRRGAVHVLLNSFVVWPKVTAWPRATPYIQECTSNNTTTLSGGTLTPETPEEVAEREKVRAVVKEWLAKQEAAGKARQE